MSERLVLNANSIQYKAESPDDFLSERREPTQRVSWMRTNVVGNPAVIPDTQVTPLERKYSGK